MRRSVSTKKKRSALRKPPPQSKANIPHSSSILSCFIGESQSAKISAVQTHLLGDSCFCLKGDCTGIVHVMEMERVLTAPCFDFSLYSLETRRLVKCNKCFYVSSLQSHRLNSRGKGKLPMVKFSNRATIIKENNAKLAAALAAKKETVSPKAAGKDTSDCFVALQQEHEQEQEQEQEHEPEREREREQEQEQKRDDDTDTSETDQADAMGVMTVTSNNSSTVDTMTKDNKKKREALVENTRLEEEKEQANNRDDEDEEGIIARLIRKTFSSWDEGNRAPPVIPNDAPDGKDEQHDTKSVRIDSEHPQPTPKPQPKQQQLQQSQQPPQQPLHSPANDAARLGPPQWLFVKEEGESTDVSGLRSVRCGEDQDQQCTIGQQMTRKAPSSPTHHRPKDPPNFDETTNGDAPDHSEDWLDEEPSPARPLFDRLHPVNDTSDNLIQYIARVSHVDDVLKTVDPVQDDACHDPPMNDPPNFPRRHNSRYQQEPSGTRHKDPKGRRRKGAPSLSSKLTNLNRQQQQHNHYSSGRANTRRYPSPTPRQRQRECDYQIREVREDAPVFDFVVPKLPKTPPYDGTREETQEMSPLDDSFRDEEDSYSPDVLRKNRITASPGMTRNLIPETRDASETPSPQWDMDRQHQHHHHRHHRRRRHTSDRHHPSSDRLRVPSKIGMTKMTPIMSLPAVDGPSKHLAMVDLPSADDSDKLLDAVIKESITVLKQSIPRNTTAIAPVMPDLRPKKIRYRRTEKRRPEETKYTAVKEMLPKPYFQNITLVRNSEVA